MENRKQKNPIKPGELESALATIEAQLNEATQRDSYLTTSKKNFDAYISYKPVPYYGTGR